MWEAQRGDIQGYKGFPKEDLMLSSKGQLELIKVEEEKEKESMS